MKCAVPCPHDRAGTPCQLEMFHAGNHSWPLVIDMDGWLPICRGCGGKAARCGCPPMGADGQSNAMEPPEPEPSAVMREVYALNAEMHAPPLTGRKRNTREAKTDTRVWVPPKVGDRSPLPPAPRRPWCPGHGWVRDPPCMICDATWKQHEAPPD